jgi:Cortactin-binding protein-2
VFKVCIELEEEKAKHARDMEQGDNVTYMLEKDRERLKQEVIIAVTLFCHSELLDSVDIITIHL